MILMRIQPMTLLSWGILSFIMTSHKLSQNHGLRFCIERQEDKKEQKDQPILEGWSFLPTREGIIQNKFLLIYDWKHYI